MHVSIRLFAGLRERAGTGARELELADGARVGDVWSALELGNEPPGLLYAVNKRYADAGPRSADGDEVALIPPVSGGDFKLTDDAALARRGRAARSRATRRARSRPSSARSATARATATVLYLEYEAYEGMAEE